MSNKEYPEVKNMKVSNSCLRRISEYYRSLKQLKEKGVRNVTSMELAEINGPYPALVRKDLSYFGCFGQRGVGYDVNNLMSVLEKILGLNREWRVAVIGAAQYSCTLMNSLPFESRVYQVRKIYDKQPQNISGVPGNVEVFHIDSLEDTLDPEVDDIVIIALPPDEIQGIIDRLGRIGIKAVLYMASRTVNVPEGMAVMNQDIKIELGMLTYRLI